MVRRTRKTGDIPWFDYTPEVLVWSQVKLVLRRYKIPVGTFQTWVKDKPRPILEYDGGDMKQGYLSADLKAFLKVVLR